MPAPLSQARLIQLTAAAVAVLGTLVSCTGRDYQPTAIVKDGVVVSVRDQKMAVMRGGKVVKTYPVSTSKFGLGDSKGSCRTPLGAHRIAAKIGTNQPKGMVFKSRKPTGECVAPNSPGRDPIVTRIMWLKGVESRNRNAYSRLIYIHGTAEERTIGTPASYGCIRMKSDDVYEAFNLVNTGDPVVIERCSISASLKALEEAERMQNTPFWSWPRPGGRRAPQYGFPGFLPPPVFPPPCRGPDAQADHRQKEGRLPDSHRTVPQGEKRQVRVPLLQNIAVPPRLIFLRPASFLSRHA